MPSQSKTTKRLAKSTSSTTPCKPPIVTMASPFLRACNICCFSWAWRCCGRIMKKYITPMIKTKGNTLTSKSILSLLIVFYNLYFIRLCYKLLAVSRNYAHWPCYNRILRRRLGGSLRESHFQCGSGLASWDWARSGHYEWKPDVSRKSRHT